jgi:hypothetical protein
MPAARRAGQHARMAERPSYAVAWRDGPTRFVGHAEVGADCLRLEGRAPDVTEGLRTIRYTDVERVDVQRVNGARGLALVLAAGRVVTIMSLDRPGSLVELADRLRKLTDSPHG